MTIEIQGCRTCRPSPLADPERLELLAETGLLAAPDDKLFNRFTRLTADLLKAPIVTISLVDSRRQVFKSSVGLGEGEMKVLETPLSESWCQHVVTSGRPLIIKNAHGDPQFKDTQPATVLGLAAYAGFPLVVEGVALGSLCAAHTQPHDWTELELRILREFADSVASEIELRLELARRHRVAAELTRSNEELNQFAHMASHDLKEPLRGVSGCLQILQSDLSELSSENQEIFDHAIHSAERMQNMVQALYHYSQVGSNVLRTQEVDLDALIQELWADLNTIIVERKATLTPIGKLGSTRGDKAQLAQLFQNLILNAVKFTQPEITPALSIGKNEDGTFFVADNGIGLEEANFTRIFDAFRRLHRGDMYPGTGMGLAICKRIVGRHGGEIWVESKPGQGARFLFSLV